MQQITASSTLPQISPVDRAALTDAKNSLVGDLVTRPLPAPVRARLAAFVGDVDRLTSHAATPSQIAAEIGGLMISFRTNRTISSGEAEATIHEYGGVLKDLPIWAIREGFRRIKNAEVDGVSLDFSPSAPRLKAVVTDVMRPLLADRYEAKRVLAARIAPPENPAMAKRVNLLEKYGPGYGIPMGTPANEVGRVSDKPTPVSKVALKDDVLRHYSSHDLGFKPKVKRDEDRYGDRYDTVTSDDGAAA